MRVRDMLTTKGSGTVHTITPDATVEELLRLLAEHDVGALVVSEDGTTVAGIVSERDIVRKLRDVQDARSVTVSTIMTTEVHTTKLDDSAGTLMAAMTERRIRHIPVVSDDGELIGILSVGDAVKWRMDQLEFERDQLSTYLHGG